MTSAIESVQKPISFDTHHDDVIHDAKVDFYGRRLATASSDRTIRIFQINETQTETLLSILSGHEGPVWQVAWAHPKFGPILASCSYDGSVLIWQEDLKKSSQNSAAGTHSTWSKIKIHRVHDSSVNSICFAPHAYGLHLACASSDGKVSILSLVGEEWKSQVFQAHNSGCNSVSWCPSAVPSSLLSLDFNALDKNPVPVCPQTIATGGCDNTVKIWKCYESQNDDGVKEEKWKLEDTLADHTDWVRDVCWRPSLGQSGQMLVSCSQDNTVLIWKQQEKGIWKSIPLKQEPFPDTLWRVSFSEYGHLLAVSCGDNTVTLWREEPEEGKWKFVGNVDETVTETVKIDEPLAVAPPASAPLPEINFTSSHTSPGHVRKMAADAGYMHPMSPLMLVSDLQSHAAMTPGYNQFTHDTRDLMLQNSHTPTVHAIQNMLANSVIQDTPVVYNDFNKDIGFVSPSPEQENQQGEPQQDQVVSYENQQEVVVSYEPQQEGAGSYGPQSSFHYDLVPNNNEISEDNLNTESSQSFEPAVYETVQSYEPAEYETAPSYEPATYENVQSYEPQSYENGYSDPNFDNQANTEYTVQEYYEGNFEPQPVQNETGDFEQQQFDQVHYDQYSYDQTSYADNSQQDQVNYAYDQSQYDQSAYNYDQAAQYDQGSNEQASYEQSQYQYTAYQPSNQEDPKQQEEDQTNYTLQYEGY